VRALLERTAQMDDVAVLVAALSVTHFRRVITAKPSLLAGVRRDLRLWLVRQDLDDDQVTDVLLMLGEAMANAVEHAYSDEVGAVTIEARRAERGLLLRVADQGRWRVEPAPGNRGRGLDVIRSLASSVALEVSSDGTALVMEYALPALVTV